MRHRISIKHAKNGEEVEVMDLVNLSLTDPQEFQNLFEQGQRVLNDSLPGEIEPDEKVLGYIEEAARELGSPDAIGRYNYIVLVTNDSVRAATSFELISDGVSLVNHWGATAVAQNARGLGLSSVLTDICEERTGVYSTQRRLNHLGTIGDVGLFDKPEDVTKYAVRLKFHHDVIGFGAATIIENDGTVRLVPYTNPGIRKSGQDEAEVPYILAIVPCVDGHLKKIAIEQGSVVGPDGKIIGDRNRLQVMDPSTVRRIAKMSFGNYREDLETYDLKQIERSENRIEKALERAKAVHLIPIYDTRFLRC